MSEAGGPFVERHNIDVEHPFIKSSGERVDVRNLEFSALTAESTEELKGAVKILPEKFQPEVNPEGMPYYQAAVVTSKKNKEQLGEEEEVGLEQDKKPKTGLFYIPGAQSLASTYGGLAVELFNQMKKASMNTVISAVLSSSASIDTLGVKFPSDIAERAAYQAALIFQLLKENPCENIFLAAHSLGGMEVHYIQPILSELIKRSNLKTKIKGLVLMAPGGVMEQEVVNLEKAKGVFEFKSLSKGIREMWPSPDDFVDVEKRLEEAKRLGDPSEEFRLKMLLSEMAKKRDRWKEIKEEEDLYQPPYLNRDERKQLVEIDEAFVFGKLNNTAEAILKNQYKDKYPVLKTGIKTLREEKDLIRLARYHLLFPALKRISGTDVKGYWSGEKDMKAMIDNLLPALGIRFKDLLKILLAKKIEVSVKRPKEIRELIETPVAFIWGAGDRMGDEFFQAEKAVKTLKNRELDERIQLRGKEEYKREEFDELSQEARYFPKAPVVFEATIKDWPHEALISDLKKFGEVITNIIGRMIEAEDRGYPQKKIELHF